MGSNSKLDNTPSHEKPQDWEDRNANYKRNLQSQVVVDCLRFCNPRDGSRNLGVLILA